MGSGLSQRQLAISSQESTARVCFVALNAFPLLADDRSVKFSGGAEVQQVILARGLAKRGFRVSMISLDFGQEDGVEIDGVTVLRTFRPSAGVPGLRFIWPRLTSVWKAMERADADIYYQRAASVQTGLMALYCRLAHRKSIFAAAGEPKIRFLRDRKIYEWGVRHVDLVAVQNAAQQRDFKSKFRRDTVLIPNSCHPVDASKGGNAIDVLWVGTIRHVKRPDRLLEVAERLPGLRFTMVGGPSIGEQALYDEIRERARRLPNLDFVGFVPYAAVGELFDRAALLVNTSDSEGFPNTFLQAWIRGIPTVSYVDCGARDGEATVGVVVGSDDEMSATVAGLMQDSGRRERMGIFCRNYSIRHHGVEAVLDRLETVVRELYAASERYGASSRSAGASK